MKQILSLPSVVRLMVRLAAGTAVLLITGCSSSEPPQTPAESTEVIEKQIESIRERPGMPQSEKDKAIAELEKAKKEQAKK